jgi:hypothetical protein
MIEVAWLWRKYQPNSALAKWYEERAAGQSPRSIALECLVFGEPAFKSGRQVMEWFSRKTSIAGVQVPNWMVVLGAIIVILIIYSFIH